jgi:hypothetical protein
MFFYTGVTMSDFMYSGCWRHVLAPKAGVCQVGFVSDDGQTIRLNISVACAQKLSDSLMEVLATIRKCQQEFPGQPNQCPTKA